MDVTKHSGTGAIPLIETFFSLPRHSMISQFMITQDIFLVETAWLAITERGLYTFREIEVTH